jgi:hypothetical protein
MHTETTIKAKTAHSTRVTVLIGAAMLVATECSVSRPCVAVAQAFLPVLFLNRTYRR